MKKAKCMYCPIQR